MTASALQIRFESDEHDNLLHGAVAAVNQWQVFIMVKGSTFCFYLFGKEAPEPGPVILMN